MLADVDATEFLSCCVERDASCLSEQLCDDSCAERDASCLSEQLCDASCLLERSAIAWSCATIVVRASANKSKMYIIRICSYLSEQLNNFKTSEMIVDPHEYDPNTTQEQTHQKRSKSQKIIYIYIVASSI